MPYGTTPAGLLLRWMQGVSRYRPATHTGHFVRASDILSGWVRNPWVYIPVTVEMIHRVCVVGMSFAYHVSTREYI
jgi:hypothetical protein